MEAATHTYTHTQKNAYALTDLKLWQDGDYGIMGEGEETENSFSEIIFFAFLLFIKALAGDIGNEMLDFSAPPPLNL